MLEAIRTSFCPSGGLGNPDTRPLRVFPPPWGVIVVVRVGVGDLDEAVDAQNSKRQYDNPMADSGNVRKPFPREELAAEGGPIRGGNL